MSVAGIGFAIPINEIKEIVTELHEKGRVTRAWLGVLIQPVSEDVAKALGIKEAKGALVADVLKGSPAEKAGIERRDVIIAFHGKEVLEHDQLPRMVARTKIGNRVPVTVIRGKKKKVIDVTVEELKEEQKKPKVEETQESKLGMTLHDVTPDLETSLGLDETLGALVSFVAPGSPAAKAGLKRGDIILEVNATPIGDTRDFHSSVNELKPDRPALLLVRRVENTIFLTLKVE